MDATLVKIFMFLFSHSRKTRALGLAWKGDTRFMQRFHFEGNFLLKGFFLENEGNLKEKKFEGNLKEIYIF